MHVLFKTLILSSASTSFSSFSRYPNAVALPSNVSPVFSNLAAMNVLRVFHPIIQVINEDMEQVSHDQLQKSYTSGYLNFKPVTFSA